MFGPDDDRGAPGVVAPTEFAPALFEGVAREEQVDRERVDEAFGLRAPRRFEIDGVRILKDVMPDLVRECEAAPGGRVCAVEKRDTEPITDGHVGPVGSASL